MGTELVDPDFTFDIGNLRPYQLSPPDEIFVRVRATDLISNPVTEIAILPLQDGMSDGENASLSSDSEVFGDAILTATAPPRYAGHMALTYRSSLAMKTSANNLVMMIGWREIQNHLDAAETRVFKENLQPIQDKVSGDLDVKHFHFEAL